MADYARYNAADEAVDKASFPADRTLEIQETHPAHIEDGSPEDQMGLGGEGSSDPDVNVGPEKTLLTKFDHPLSRQQTTPDVLVDFEAADDPYKALNWPFWKKFWTTSLYGLTILGATWGSSIYASALDGIDREFHIGSTVATLGVTLYLFGFATGPLIWAPLSEVYGRRPAVLYPLFCWRCLCLRICVCKRYPDVDDHTLLVRVLLFRSCDQYWRGPW